VTILYPPQVEYVHPQYFTYTRKLTKRTIMYDHYDFDIYMRAIESPITLDDQQWQSEFSFLF